MPENSTVTVSLEDYTKLVEAKGFAEGRLFEQKHQLESMLDLIENRIPQIADKFVSKFESWEKLFS